MKVKVMVVGSGGREHAIIKKLKENDTIEKIFALPGNGGISKDAECVDIKATDIDAIVEFAEKNNIDFAVVAPDDPLVLGAVDKLAEKNIPAFGPNKNAAIIEGSKVFSKELMKKYGIPTAEYNVFGSAEKAVSFIKQNKKYPIVIKADGLALGKGVLICADEKEALDGIRSIMEDKVFGNSGSSIVIEEFLEGPEISVLAFTDGKTIKPMVSSMDHKRALDDDKGLNTGGMGTVAPNPYYTKDIEKECMEKIFIPTIEAMNKEGRTFKGCLYFGLMATKDGVKVIEYNCRFGDPETQVVLPLLKTDLFTIMRATVDGTLDKVDVEFSADNACCIMLASGGYPTDYKKGYEITGIENIKESEVYHSGTAIKDNKFITNGGRVLGVSATAKDLQKAIDKAYSDVKNIYFKDMHYRKDIGKRALQGEK